MDTNDYYKNLYRSKHLKDLKTDEIVDKIKSAVRWLTIHMDDESEDDIKRWEASHIAYMAMADELSSRDKEEPDYDWESIMKEAKEHRKKEASKHQQSLFIEDTKNGKERKTNKQKKETGLNGEGRGVENGESEEHDREAESAEQIGDTDKVE